RHLERRRHAVAQPVEGVAQRLAPALVPALLAARVAAAVGGPAADAVRAAPGGVLLDLDLVVRRETLQELRVIGELGGIAGGQPEQRVGERHVTVAMMVAVGLAVGRDVDQARAVVAGKSAEQPLDELLAVVEELLVGHRLGDRAVVEEQRDLAAGGEVHEVGPRRIDAVFPLEAPPLAARRPHARTLSLRQDGEAQAVLGEDLEALEIDGRLRQPHPFRRAAEAVLEVAEPPDHLCAFVARVAERQDGVPVGLSDRRAMAGEALEALAVRRQHGLVRLRLPALQPGEQRRSEVEADARVVIDDAGDAPLDVEHPRGRVGSVGLRGDALVPVVVRIGGVLQLDGFQPRVLPRRLIKMAVNTEIPLHQPASSPGMESSFSSVTSLASLPSFASFSLCRNSTPKGGRLSASDCGRPCVGIGAVSTPPGLPTSLPPYSAASLLRSSRQRPGAGTPMRYSWRGTGVKLKTTATSRPGVFPRRRNAMTLWSASEPSIHSKPSGSQSSSWRAGSSR